MDTFSSDVKVVNLLTTSPIDDDRRSLLANLSDFDRETDACLKISAGNLFKFCCRSSIEYQVAVSD